MLWEEIESVDQEALIEWYNTGNLDNEDRERLADLFTDGKFSHWECPECEIVIMVGQPDDWGNFQGVGQSESLGQLCADCGAKYLSLKEHAEM